MQAISWRQEAPLKANGAMKKENGNRRFWEFKHFELWNLVGHEILVFMFHIFLDLKLQMIFFIYQYVLCVYQKVV